MKGIIFNIAENYIIEKHGYETLKEIVTACSLETKEPFVGPNTYPDADLLEIVGKAVDILKTDLASFLKSLGHYSFRQLSDRHPNFVEGYTHPKDFLLTVEGVIHMEVRKLYEESKLPTFQYQDLGENELIITYFSERKLYPFVDGLIDGVVDYFGYKAEKKSTIYEKDGVELCDFHIKFSA